MFFPIPNLKLEFEKSVLERFTLSKLEPDKFIPLNTEFSKFESLNGHLEGPLVYGISSDAVAPAKLLVDFSKENEGLVVKGGSLDGSILDLNSVKALASIPPRDELIGKLLGVASGPIQGFVRTLNEVPSRLVRVLSAIRDQK